MLDACLVVHGSRVMAQGQWSMAPSGPGARPSLVGHEPSSGHQASSSNLDARLDAKDRSLKATRFRTWASWEANLCDSLAVSECWPMPIFDTSNYWMQFSEMFGGHSDLYFVACSLYINI